jgi:RNA polymerase sigma factor (sigma-70 family)
MTDGVPPTAITRLRSSLARTDETRTDAQLLIAFTRDQDTDAFANLVHRHGPRVFGICRRVTGHDQDAEDAFQAVFVVLARRAADVAPPSAVGSWLYGVAFRTAQDARVVAARRRSRVTPIATLPDVPDSSESQPPDAELAALLDAEIAALPDHYRSVVVLCELNGLSRSVAAKQLGIAEGTLSSRLAEARKRLAIGLKRKGFALPAVLGAALASNISGSEILFPLACRLGQLTAAGEQIPAGVSLTLANRGTRMMLLKKLTTLSLLTLGGVAFLGAGWMTFHRVFADDKPAVKAQAAKPVAATPVNKLFFWRHGELFLIDPDGKNEKKVFDRLPGQSINGTTLSLDGKKVAYLTNTFEVGKPIPPDQLQKYFVAVREVNGKDVTEFKLSGQILAWSPDGKELLVTSFVDAPRGPKDGPPKATTTILELATKKETILPLPEGHYGTAFAPDGQQVLTMHYAIVSEKPSMVANLVSRNGQDVVPISDSNYLFESGQLAPDGKTLLFRGAKAPNKVPEQPLNEHLIRMYIQPIGGKVVELADVPLNGEIMGYSWSPDSKKIAYTWRQIHADKPEMGKADERETESHLCICDADGKNHKTLLSEKGMAQYQITLSHVDWR